MQGLQPRQSRSRRECVKLKQTQDLNQFNQLSSRILRIEHVLELALPQYWSGSSPGDTHGERYRSVSSGPDDENLSGAEEQDPVGGSFQRGSWFGHGASGAIASASVLEQVRNRHTPRPSILIIYLAQQCCFFECSRQPRLADGFGS